jgi:nicotinamide riboside transporter PnuC
MSDTYLLLILSSVVLTVFVYDVCIYSIFAWTRGLAHRAKLDDNKELRVSYTARCTLMHTVCIALTLSVVQ